MTRDELIVFNVAAFLADAQHEKNGLTVVDLAAALTVPETLASFTAHMTGLADKGEKYMEIRYRSDIQQPVQWTIHDGGRDDS